VEGLASFTLRPSYSEANLSWREVLSNQP
jgi:hypothetical protein